MSSAAWRFGWSRRLSLRHRILAVNIFAVAILAGSIFYLDSFPKPAELRRGSIRRSPRPL